MSRSTFTRPPRDETLSARLDDELPPSQLDAIDAWLHAHPEGAPQLRGWQGDRDALRAQFDPVLDEPVPDRLTRLVWQPAGARRTDWMRIAAAVAVFALGAALGAAGGWFGRGHDATLAAASPVTPAATPASGAWLQRAAVAHAVYAPEVRHPVEVKAQEEHLARWLTRRVDAPVKLFDLRAQGFELVGGRLLPDASGPSAQLMYQRIGSAPVSASNPQGAADRVTVYLRKPEVETPAAFRHEQQGALGMFYWVEGRAGYALVGTVPREELLRLAQAIYDQGR